jgi:hypothetical protein
MKLQITNYRYQINYNNQNSKSEMAESFGPELSAIELAEG